MIVAVGIGGGVAGIAKRHLVRRANKGPGRQWQEEPSTDDPAQR